MTESNTEELRGEIEKIIELNDTAKALLRDSDKVKINYKTAYQNMSSSLMNCMTQCNSLAAENDRLKKDNDRLWRLIESHYAE